MNYELLNRAAAFIWQEADQLDHADYADWLSSWADDGLYIVPIDPNETDFENTLNYAYDDAGMREKRVRRLLSGESVSTMPTPRTIRLVSRFRIVGGDSACAVVRCAQELREFRQDMLRQYTADVTYELVASGDSFKIRRKIIRLINSTDTLQGIGYIL